MDERRPGRHERAAGLHVRARLPGPGAAPPPSPRPSRSSASLMDHHLDHPEDLPATYRDTDADRVTQVADYVAGMTDRFALRDLRATVRDRRAWPIRPCEPMSDLDDRLPEPAPGHRHGRRASPTSTRAGSSATTASSGRELDPDQVRALGRTQAPDRLRLDGRLLGLGARSRVGATFRDAPALPGAVDAANRSRQRHRIVIVSSKFPWAIPRHAGVAGGARRTGARGPFPLGQVGGRVRRLPGRHDACLARAGRGTTERDESAAWCMPGTCRSRARRHQELGAVRGARRRPGRVRSQGEAGAS